MAGPYYYLSKATKEREASLNSWHGQFITIRLSSADVSCIKAQPCPGCPSSNDPEPGAHQGWHVRPKNAGYGRKNTWISWDLGPLHTTVVRLRLSRIEVGGRGTVDGYFAGVCAEYGSEPATPTQWDRLRNLGSNFTRPSEFRGKRPFPTSQAGKEIWLPLASWCVPCYSSCFHRMTGTAVSHPDSSEPSC